MTPRLAAALAEALASGQPVVALESSVFTHGLPAPWGLNTAAGAERAVRDGGALPATIGVVAGVPCVGLTQAEIEQLAAQGPLCLKAGRRDLAWAAVNQLNAGTTVSATLAIAHAVGIRVFATGGIGGVHREGAHSFDVSADLVELARTPVAVVCSGAKIILDLPRTLELLETLGVPVVGWGCREFPGFYLAATGLRLEQVVEAPSEAAGLARTHWQAGGQGLLFCVPPPRELNWSAGQTERIIRDLQAEAEQKGIVGKHLTPFLLRRLGEISQGQTVSINHDLIVANARAAAVLAVALTKCGA
jgi:pseudouridine-5'-phosphate glycosidase